MKNRRSYFREYHRLRKTPAGRRRFRRRRTPLECKNLQAALRFYRDCGLKPTQMVKLVGKALGGVTLSQIYYFLHDPRCKADAT